MTDLFFMGGPLFMSILSLLLIAMVSWIAYHFIITYFFQNPLQEKSLRKLQYGKSIGLFAMVIGILGQLIGLFGAFSVIEQNVSIAPSAIYGGIKVSMISTFYGIIIYLLSILLWFITSILIEKKLD